jgi:hypothetical protein
MKNILACSNIKNTTTITNWATKAAFLPKKKSNPKLILPSYFQKKIDNILYWTMVRIWAMQPFSLGNEAFLI